MDTLYNYLPLFSYQSYTKEHKLRLLSYVLSDLEATSDDLDGIQLLPLANGKFTEFDEEAAGVSAGSLANWQTGPGARP